MNNSTEFQSRKLKKATNREELDQYLKELPKENFGKRFQELEEKYGKKRGEVIALTTISKSMAYDIINGRPSRKHQIIQLGLALGVNLDEMNELLKLSGHKELYAKLEEDAIVIYGINNGLNLCEINDLLIEKKCKMTFEEKDDKHAKRK